MIHPAIPSSLHKLNGLIPWGGGILGVGLRFWWKSAIRNLYKFWNRPSQLKLISDSDIVAAKGLAVFRCSRSWFDIKNRKGMSTARAVCSKPSCLRGCLAEMEHPTIRLSILSGAKRFSMDTVWWRFYVVCSKCRRYIGLFVIVKVHQYSYYIYNIIKIIVMIIIYLLTGSSCTWTGLFAIRSAMVMSMCSTPSFPCRTERLTIARCWWYTRPWGKLFQIFCHRWNVIIFFCCLEWFSLTGLLVSGEPWLGFLHWLWCLLHWPADEPSWHLGHLWGGRVCWTTLSGSRRSWWNQHWDRNSQGYWWSVGVSGNLNQWNSNNIIFLSSGSWNDAAIWHMASSSNF